MNGEKERNKTTGLLIINAIIWIPLLIIILLIIGIAKVNAAQYRYINNVNNGAGSWTNVSYGTEYTNSPVSLTSNGKSVFQFKDTAFGNNKYDLLLNFDFTVTANGIYVPLANNNRPVDLMISAALEKYNGTTLVSIADKCTTDYVQTNTYPNDNQAIMRILGTIKCTAVDGNGYYPYFSFAARQTGRTPSPTSIAKIKFISWTYTMNQAASDTNAIINSQTANTQSIINNNNTNTQQIINNQNNNTQQVIDSIQDWEGANQPNSSTSDQAFNKEDLIFDSLEMDFTLERPQIDTTANDLIWNWVHRLLFSNTIIAGVTIALLTFGVIKLILGR